MFTLPMWFSTCSQLHRSTRGFALVELLVTISILVLVSSVILARQSTFNSVTLLENQAYEIAFDVRQTQLRAVSAQGGTTDDFRTPFEIRFTTSDSTYQVYRNDGGTETPLGAPLRLDERFVIAAINDQSDTSVGSEARIRFSRPNLTAQFYDGSGSIIAGVEDLKIVVQPRDDATRSRTVRISQTGQIDVTN